MLALPVNDDAEVVATQILAAAGLGGPQNAVRLASALGYRIHRATRREMGGLFGASSGGDLWVARTSNRARDEWTLAHELVHQEIRRACDGQEDTEAFVDRCVGALLMPRTQVRDHVQNGVVRLPDLCRQFGTSYSSTTRRVLEVVRACAVEVGGKSAGRVLVSPGVAPHPEVVTVAAGLAREALRSRAPAVASAGGWGISAWLTPGQTRAIAIAVENLP